MQYNNEEYSQTYRYYIASEPAPRCPPSLCSPCARTGLGSPRWGFGGLLARNWIAGARGRRGRRRRLVGLFGCPRYMRHLG